MRPRGLSTIFLFFALLFGAALAASDAEKTSTTSVSPCTATSASGAFYDLRPDIAVVEEEGSKHRKGVVTEDYHARGWDYGSNFTLNLCAAVVKPVSTAVGIEGSSLKNVGAYYESKGKIYSLGQQSSVLIPRGRKLVLEYTGGSPCANSGKDKRTAAVHEGARYKYYDDDDSDAAPSTSKSNKSLASQTKSYDDDDDGKKNKGSSGTRHKSLTISFLCDRDPLNTEAAVSFINTDPDECAYFFEVRSQHACAGAEPHKPGSVGPGSVFVIIFFIAVLVYLVGGVFYQRTVAHARGWRQLPNYSLWAGIGGCLKDFAVILISSCARFFPSRRGYRTLSISPNGRSRNRDDENRLIDQLDEEWDD